MVRVLEGRERLREYKQYRIISVIAAFVLLALAVIAERIW